MVPFMLAARQTPVEMFAIAGRAHATGTVARAWMYKYIILRGDVRDRDREEECRA